MNNERCPECGREGIVLDDDGKPIIFHKMGCNYLAKRQKAEETMR